MKRMLKYIIASSLLLMFSGCNDWLDVQPKSVQIFSSKQREDSKMP